MELVTFKIYVLFIVVWFLALRVDNTFWAFVDLNHNIENHSLYYFISYSWSVLGLKVFDVVWIRNGIKQRKNSWQDGVVGTNCPIPPKSNFTYKFQTKDQIGSYTYFPSTLMHRAAGGFGALNVYARSVIPVPYAKPAADYSLLIGDWYKTSHRVRPHHNPT